MIAQAIAAPQPVELGFTQAVVNCFLSVAQALFYLCS